MQILFLITQFHFARFVARCFLFLFVFFLFENRIKVSSIFGVYVLFYSFYIVVECRSLVALLMYKYHITDTYSMFTNFGWIQIVYIIFVYIYIIYNYHAVYLSRTRSRPFCDAVMQWCSNAVIGRDARWCGDFSSYCVIIGIVWYILYHTSTKVN